LLTFRVLQSAEHVETSGCRGRAANPTPWDKDSRHEFWRTETILTVKSAVTLNYPDVRRPGRRQRGAVDAADYNKHVLALQKRLRRRAQGARVVQDAPIPVTLRLWWTPGDRRHQVLAADWKDPARCRCSIARPCELLVSPACSIRRGSSKDISGPETRVAGGSSALQIQNGDRNVEIRLSPD